MPEAAAKAARDTTRRKVGLFLWGLPLIAILASALDGVTPMTRGVVWAVALLCAGAACVTNACRSGRLHCYITGPLFVALGAVSLLYGAGILPLGPRGWLWIGAVLIVGTALLTIIPEGIWGRYSHGREGRCC